MKKSDIITHNFDFKSINNFGYIIYNQSKGFERGKRTFSEKDHYAIYIKCSQKQMDAIMEKATARKMESLKNDIDKKQKEVIQLYEELVSFSFECIHKK